MGADRAVLVVFSVTVVLPWALLLFVTRHEEGCPAAAAEAAVLYNPFVHGALVLAYAGPPWFTLADMAAKAAAELGGYEALSHRRLQWIIVSRLVPVWAWLYAFLYNTRHDDVAVFIACKCADNHRRNNGRADSTVRVVHVPQSSWSSRRVWRRSLWGAAGHHQCLLRCKRPRRAVWWWCLRKMLGSAGSG